MGIPKISSEVFESSLDYIGTNKNPSITKFLVDFYQKICLENPFLSETIAKTMKLMKEGDNDKAAMFLILSVYLINKQIEVNELNSMFKE